MKKVIIFLSLIIISGASNAQKFKGGLIAGFNASQVDGDSYAGYNKFGFVLGAFATADFTELFAGELQIRYSQKGAYKKVTDTDLSKYISKLNYVEIPVLLKLHQNQKLTWHAGPSFGYLFKYSVEDENGPLNDDAINFRKFDLSALAGLQYQISTKLGVSLTFSYSLVPIADHPNDPIHFRQPGLYNNVITILFSYQI